MDQDLPRVGNRAELRDALLAAASRMIAESGNKALRARDLASEVGCALGSIYNVFADMDALVLAVRIRTLDRLEAEIINRLGHFEASDPMASPRRLTVLAEVYIEFAHANWRLWSAAFEYSKMDALEDQAYLARLNTIFAHIEAPLAAFLPELSPLDQVALARALFGSVHGIILLGLNSAFGPVALDQLKWQVGSILSATLRGLLSPAQ